MPQDEAERLLVREIRVLNKWKIEMEEENDSSNAFMFSNKLVKDLYQHPYAHLKLTMNIISDEEIEGEVKKTLVKLSQCVELSDYIKLGERILKSFTDSGSGQEVLRTYLSPGLEWGTLLDENYQSQHVILLLKKFYQNEEIAKVNEPTIELIMTGSNASLITEYRKQGSPFPSMPCSE